MNTIKYPKDVNFTTESLFDYIIEVATEHQKQARAFAFAFIVVDFEDAHVSKILSDEDYLNALDSIAGEYLTIFYLDSEYMKLTSEMAKKSRSRWMEFGMEKVDAPPSYSPSYLAEKLINDKNLPSPSIIFFQVDGFKIIDHTIARLRKPEIESGFNEMKKIIKNGIEGISKVENENRENRKEIFSLLKTSIEGSEFWTVVNIGYAKLMKLKEFLSIFRLMG